jgi:arylformamidase
VKNFLPFQNILDISQPVASTTACFPGDTPFSKVTTLNYQDSGIINLTALTMSPHVGTHADAPVHIKGSLEGNETRAGELNLNHFLGPVAVLNLAPLTEAITGKIAAEKVQAAHERGLRRVLFRTTGSIDVTKFQEPYAYLGDDTARLLTQLNFLLVGLDTPSVDHTQSKTLIVHHLLDEGGLSWLENLDLTQVDEGDYYLVALPLKLTELEASPVRAVLLS